MSCARWEEKIALYAEGDLPERDTRRVEEHLGECPECRRFAAALAESQLAVKSLRGEAPEAAALEAVRRRVLEQIASEPRVPGFAWGWAWKYGLAGLALAVTGGLWWWPSPSREAAPPAMVVELPRAPVPAPPPAPAPKRRRVARPPVVPSEPLMLKLVTDDPNVVIVWLIDRNGG